MKLSIETKVASVVAAGFLAVTVGVVAQANGPGAADNYGLTSRPDINTYMIQKRLDSSPLKHTRSETGAINLSLRRNVDAPDL
jgi:hypothetical protein